MIDDMEADEIGGLSRRGLLGGLGAIIAAGLVAEATLSGSPALAAMVWWFPLAKRYTMTSGYGIRVDPVTHVEQLHDGCDFGAPNGTPIYAMRSGTVTYSGLFGGYGNFVRVKHDDGYETGYGHQSLIVAKNGQAVQAGTLLGYVGSTGQSTGPHLHLLMARNGSSVNPTDILNAAPLPTGTAQPIDKPSNSNDEDDDMGKVVMIGDSNGLWLADLGAKTKWNIAMGGLGAADGIARKDVFVAMGIPFYDKQSGILLAGFTDITSKSAPYN